MKQDITKFLGAELNMDAKSLISDHPDLSISILSMLGPEDHAKLLIAFAKQENLNEYVISQPIWKHRVHTHFPNVVARLKDPYHFRDQIELLRNRGIISKHPEAKNKGWITNDWYALFSYMYQCRYNALPKPIRKLMSAIKDKQLFSIEALKVDPKYYATFAHAAAECGYVEIFEQLGKLGTYFILNGNTPIFSSKISREPGYVAALNGHVPVLEFIAQNMSLSWMIAPVIPVSLLSDSSVEMQKSQGSARPKLLYGLKEETQLLIHRKNFQSAINTHLDQYPIDIYDPKDQDIDFMAAVYNKNRDAIRFFVKNGMTMDSPYLETLRLSTRQRAKMFSIAASRGDIDFIEWLIQLNIQPNGIDMRPDKSHAGFFAALKGDLNMILKHKELSLDMHKECNGAIPLFYASYGGHTEVVRKLLEGQNPQAIHRRNDIGQTAMFYAAQGGASEMVKFLKELGLDIDETDFNGNTPLMLAVEAGEEHTVKTLVELGATIDVANDQGVTAQFFAALEGNLSMLKLLESLGFDLNKENKCSGFTPLLIAILAKVINRESTEVTAYLMEKYYNKDFNVCGNTLYSCIKVNSVLQPNIAPDFNIMKLREFLKRSSNSKFVFISSSIFVSIMPHQLAEALNDTETVALYEKLISSSILESAGGIITPRRGLFQEGGPRAPQEVAQPINSFDENLESNTTLRR